MIGVSHLSVALGGRTVLHDVSLSVAPGQLVALCGPNGAGKSTLLRALAGLLSTDSGQGSVPNRLAAAGRALRLGADRRAGGRARAHPAS